MMKLRLRQFARDDRGQSLAVMAVMAAGLLAMLSLSIDLGMLYTARAEAQSAAEAAALAGAQEFMVQGRTAVASAPFAQDSALAWAVRNGVRGTAITPSEVQIAVDINRQQVSVRIDRDSIPLWFARLVGRQVATVNAHAAARAAEAGGATCVLPFAVPDIWHEPPGNTGGDDVDGNRIMDTNENWIFGDDAGESYIPYQTGSPTETGYGSGHRNGQTGSSPVTFPVNGDYGRKLVLKVQRPQDALVSGFFYPFNHPGNNGGSDYREAISGCDPGVISLGVPIDILPGDKVGPTRQGVTQLISKDPGATWDESTNQLVSQYGFNSPRVRIVPLYDPKWIAAVCGGPNGNCTGAGTLELEFNNLAVMFVEDFNRFDDTVVGRFMYYAQGVAGSGSGGTTGSLVRILQLVE